jgi:hypothetical protein
VWFEVENVMRHVAQWERQAVSSVLHFNETAPVAAAVAAMNEQLGGQEQILIAALRAQAAAAGVATEHTRGRMDDRVPVRLTRGPLNFGLPESRLPPNAAAWYLSREFTLSGDERFELVNFIDGVRSVADIRNAMSAEFRPVSLGLVGRYLDDLVTVGVVAWK